MNWFYIIALILSFSCITEASISVSFIIDLDPPRLGSGGLFPPPDTVLNETTVTILADVEDYGVGLWMDYLSSSAEWGDSIGSYITWSINGGPFIDTLWDTFGTTWTFNNRDTITVCLNAIDEIHNYGCSCPPNVYQICWSFICCVPNLQPEIWDVNFAQTTDGSRLVDIYYYADDEDNDSILITLEVSTDRGITWDIVEPETYIAPSDTGWVEPSPSVMRHIIWDMGTDFPECYFEDSGILVRVWGDDGTYYRCE